MKKSLSSLAAAAVLGAGLASSPIVATQAAPAAQPTEQGQSKQGATPQAQQRTTKRVKQLHGGYIPTRGDVRSWGPGWTNRHVKRLAQKARNVKSFRAANR